MFRGCVVSLCAAVLLLNGYVVSLHSWKTSSPSWLKTPLTVNVNWRYIS